MSFSSQLLGSYFWQLAGKWVTRSLGIISTLVLVRILTPEDFGIAAQSIMVIMLFQALSQTGAEQYIIKKKKVTTSLLMSAWTLNLLTRSLMASVVFIFAPNIAHLLEEPILSDVLRVACLVPIISNFLSPRLILFRKDMMFKQLSYLDVCVKFISFTITISLAFYLQNYWALIWGNLAATIANVVLSYFIAPIFPSMNLKHVREQWEFTKGIFLSSILGYLRSKADIFIISSKFGNTSVGHYSVAQEFSMLPLTEVITPIMSPLFSSFAKIADNTRELEDKVFKYLSLAYLFLFPSIAGIFFLSEEIVSIVLGEKWIEAAPILANLSLLMAVFLTNNTFKQIFILKNLFKGIITIDILGLLLIASALFITTIGSAEHFSIYRACIGIVIIFATMLIVKITLKFRLLVYFTTIVVPAIATMAMLLTLRFTKSLIEGFDIGIYYYFISSILIGIFSYSIVVFALLCLLRKISNIWFFNWSFILDILSKIFSKLSPQKA